MLNKLRRRSKIASSAAVRSVSFPEKKWRVKAWVSGKSERVSERINKGGCVLNRCDRSLLGKQTTLTWGGGEKFFFDTGWDIIFRGNPPLGGGGVLQKKLFLPVSHVPHTITVFTPQKMPLALVGIPMCGYSGY